MAIYSFIHITIHNTMSHIKIYPSKYALFIEDDDESPESSHIQQNPSIQSIEKTNTNNFNQHKQANNKSSVKTEVEENWTEVKTEVKPKAKKVQRKKAPVKSKVTYEIKESIVVEEPEQLTLSEWKMRNSLVKCVEDDNIKTTTSNDTSSNKLKFEIKFVPKNKSSIKSKQNQSEKVTQKVNPEKVEIKSWNKIVKGKELNLANVVSSPNQLTTNDVEDFPAL